MRNYFIWSYRLNRSTNEMPRIKNQYSPLLNNLFIDINLK
ncbi:hypothetical protein ymoll0001_25290 [Yersinia mollaretii ATCC 43969]|uniref:Uncharacterized protein n=1 Tax=Yersinia mollaretii (strain ATCC 43969 / DSM 18520 / CIP 103324 / CNY 7263 / WAIP 204) TaxID=349967 RepID=A0ABM9YDT6_YERMW|nr:hypothetical protein ymoll0001_25290 [Yersinia mollaretii ATCC 43969]